MSNAHSAPYAAFRTRGIVISLGVISGIGMLIMATYVIIDTSNLAGWIGASIFAICMLRAPRAGVRIYADGRVLVVNLLRSLEVRLTDIVEVGLQGRILTGQMAYLLLEDGRKLWIWGIQGPRPNVVPWAHGAEREAERLRLAIRPGEGAG